MLVDRLRVLVAVEARRVSVAVDADRDSSVLRAVASGKARVASYDVQLHEKDQLSNTNQVHMYIQQQVHAQVAQKTSPHSELGSLHLQQRSDEDDVTRCAHNVEEVSCVFAGVGFGHQILDIVLKTTQNSGIKSGKTH